MNFLDHKHYVFYENFNSKPNFLKGVELYHENDVFLMSKNLNQDRELTGGFKLSIVTDYLKWRWVRLTNKKEDNVLTYQSISILGAGYTPYIRYRNNMVLADTFHKLDRPFSSFVCIERAKHRTWRKGLLRNRGEFQVGAIGVSSGRKIQAKLHEDVIPSSQFVYGWDNQIGNGGRMVWQINHKFDLLLYSNTNKYKSIFTSNKYVDKTKKCFGINIIGEMEGKLGTLMTTVGGGIRFSTLDFLKQSGNQMIISNDNSRDGFAWKFDLGINYRYVFHNSLLEGIGLFETFDEDTYDKAPIDKHVFKYNEVYRQLFILDFGLSLRWRKTTVFYRHNFNTIEYKSRLNNINFEDSNFISKVDPKDLEFYQNTVIPEQKSFLNNRIFGRQYYGYGTVGVSYIVE